MHADNSSVRMPPEPTSAMVPDLGLRTILVPVALTSLAAATMKQWADRALSAVAEVASSRGLDVDGIRVLRVGENAVVLLPAASVLARVMPDRRLIAQVRHELDAASWFVASDQPVAKPVVDESLLANGYVISLWEYIAEARPADLVTLAGCLRRLHSAVAPSDVDLRPVDPFARFARRLKTGTTLDDDDRAFLIELRDRLRSQWQRASFDLPRSVVHGDAHMENLLKGPDGRPASSTWRTWRLAHPNGT